MDKVVKREVVLKKTKIFLTPKGKIIAFGELALREREEKENLAFWNSVDVMDLSPEQRKHFKEIMRKEVKESW